MNLFPTALTDLSLYIYDKTLKANNRYLKNGVLTTIVDAIKHVSIQLYRVQPEGVI